MVSWRLRWLRRILCTRQSGMQPFVTCHHASLPSFLSVATVNYQRQQKDGEKNKCKEALSWAGRQLYHNFLHISTLQLFVLFFWRWIHLWGIALTVRQTSTKRAVKEQEIHKPPPPSPSGHSKFYIPLLISITITVIRQHARHEVDDPVEQMQCGIVKGAHCCWEGPEV